jgi:hypothetical protein
MSLLGLLRREGPITATQTAAELGENVPNCSFHLRQMAKYGLVERVPVQMRAATDELTMVLLGQYLSRAETYIATRGDEPTEWRTVTGFGDTVFHVTPAELGELTAEMQKLLARYEERQSPVPVGDGQARRA